MTAVLAIFRNFAPPEGKLYWVVLGSIECLTALLVNFYNDEKYAGQTPMVCSQFIYNSFKKQEMIMIYKFLTFNLKMGLYWLKSLQKSRLIQRLTIPTRQMKEFVHSFEMYGTNFVTKNRRPKMSWQRQFCPVMKVRTFSSQADLLLNLASPPNNSIE